MEIKIKCTYQLTSKLGDMFMPAFRLRILWPLRSNLWYSEKKKKGKMKESTMISTLGITVELLNKTGNKISKLYVLTTSSLALVSTWGSMIKRDILISGVAAFLWLDEVDILSREDDRDPDFDPLETADDESFEIDFLVVLLAVLSMDVEGILDDDDEESDGDDLTLDVREDCPLLASDLLPWFLKL